MLRAGPELGEELLQPKAVDAVQRGGGHSSDLSGQRPRHTLRLADVLGRPVETTTGAAPRGTAPVTA